MVSATHNKANGQGTADSGAVLGEVLKKKKIITDDQLRRALDEQSDRMRRLNQSVNLGLILVEQQHITEEELLKAVNEHYHLSLTSFPGNFENLPEGHQESRQKKRALFHFPIWLQLSLTITLIVTSIIFLLDFFVLSRQKNRVYQQTIKVGMVSLTYFDTNARIPLLENDILQLNTMIKNAAEVEGLVYAIIIDQQKEIKAHTDHRKIGTKFQQIEHMSKIHQVGNTNFFDYTLPGGERILNLNRPIIFKSKQLGQAHVGVSLDFIEEDVRKERLLLFWMTALVIIFGILVAIFFGLRFSRPISKLVKATQEISKGKYRHNIDLTRKDELGNLACAFNQMNEELWLKSLMQESFGKYVGPQVLDLIMENPEDSWLQGQTNEATILFADIRGFTTYSESKTPQVIVEELNQYFELANNAILEHNGYIDKFIGDGVLAVFGVPAYQKDHIKNAIGAAFKMQTSFRNADVNGNVLLSSIGIGIHTGLVVSGNIGSSVKMEYTVIGDSVNVASRISEIAAPGEIIISKAVYEQIPGFIEAQSLRPHKVKGRAEPIEIYRALGIRERRHGEWS